MSEYVQQKTWSRKNRNWILAICVIVIGFLMSILLVFKKPIGDITKAMVDLSVYHNAFEQASADQRVIALLGEPRPIHFLELIEGEVRYDENDHKVSITTRIKGSKQNGSMDIVARKKDTTWYYEVIRIRTKKPKKVIVVLDETE